MKNQSICIAFVLILTVGCSPYFHQPFKIKESRLGAESTQYKDLVSLPAPKEKIVAAVYKFRDQTGQYKETEIGSSWSTAVTQGSTSILLRAMEESNWFVPIERESLSNLLNERKIIRSSRANYVPDESKDPLLPPLLFAGILLEGGIVSFDSNVLTGGAGARYFGAGASTQYREDRVTIYLRAVSTGNGRILKTVYTSKTILSQKIDVNFFRFVKVKRLLEMETGFTYNEPGEMAIKDAIEKAVIGLVVD
jgi:curli production assembly/transport component CsgG